MTTQNFEISVEQQINETMRRWATAFTAELPDDLIAMYAEDASLWGTLSPEQRTTPSSIRDYFEQAFTFSDRKVIFHESNTRGYGNIAISSGTYTFSLTKDGTPLVIPSRYSLTFINRDDRWLIIEHHSSALPERK